jgi:hypothetical protein
MACIAFYHTDLTKDLIGIEPLLVKVPSKVIVDIQHLYRAQAGKPFPTGIEQGNIER